MRPAPSAERAKPMFWTGLALAGAVALVGIFGLHPSSVWGVEQGLAAKVETALTRAGIGGVDVDMEGQTARLIGGVSNNEVRAHAIEVALRAIGPGGAWAGGVTRVDAEELVSGAPVSPFTWRAVRQGRGIVLSGHAPTPRVARELVETARRAFARGEVENRMTVAPGAPSTDWGAVASDALRQLARLSNGEARMSDQHVIVLGQGERAAVADVTNHYRSPLPAPYRARVEVFAPGEGLSFADLGDLDLAQGNAETCQTAFERMMARNVINFASGSAELDRASLPVLDRLASIALRCDQFSIQIAGHTDNVGVRDANMELSRRRAQAVAGYLVGQGVSRARLNAVGFGPDRPRASNATAVGQAANRRIEFTVNT